MRAVQIFLILLLTGCNSGDLPDYYELGGLQVLALKAAPNEVDPSSAAVNVAITPLITDIKGAGRALTYTIETCLDPGVNLGATPTCDADPAKTSQNGTVTPAAPRYTEAMPPITVSVPSTVFTGRSEVDKYNGVPFLVMFRLETASGEKETSFCRIMATTRTTTNAAPSLVEIQRDGVAITSLPTEKSTLKPKLGGSPEEYSLKAPDGSTVNRTESLTVTWFISQGELKFSRTHDDTENTWTPPTSATLPLFLVTVLRDGRGGVDFKMVGP